jgi:hypothetical protein
MSVNKVLFPTAALATVLGATAFPVAVAAQGTDNPLTLSFDGVVGTGNHANAYGEAKLGSGFDQFDDDVFFVGSVGLSRSINGNWDWKLSVSKLGYTDNTISDFSGQNSSFFTSASGRTETAVSFGRHLDIGLDKARLGLGLAYANANASTEKGFSAFDNDGNYINSDLATEFQGIGPQISLDLQSAPVTANGKLSVIGGVDVSLLAGQYQHSKGFEAYDGNSNQLFSENATSAHGDMMTAGIMLGLQYDANENTFFRAGIRHDVTRMDQAAYYGPTVDSVSVQDGRTSFFVGMDVSF